MTLAGDLARIAQTVGRIEAKVDGVIADHETLHADVEILKDAAKIAAGIALNRRKVYARLAAVLAGLATLTTGGTALVSYYSNTTHPPAHTQTIIVKSP